MEQRLYGVSYGNGNDGVSHIFADFYVWTDNPWLVAKLAMVTRFKSQWQAKALEECHVDGDAEHTVQAVIYEPLDAERCEDDNMSWCDANGAYALVDVFPEEDPREGPPRYGSIEEAFGDDVTKAVT